MRYKKQLIWQVKTDEIAFMKRNSDLSFADFFELADFEGAYNFFFHDFWSRLVCFCTSVDVKVTGQSKNAFKFAISTTVWELES